MQLLNQNKFGSYEGTGAAVSVTCGFKPIFVMAINEEDGDVMWIHIQGMADASALQITNHADTQLSFISSNAVTLSTTGFTAGTTLSESGKTIRYIAF